jgi:hypothetical protein
MSLHDFSNLAVLDITDESAAIHNGGFEVRGFVGTSNTSANGGPVDPLPNNATKGARVQSYTFGDQVLQPFDNLTRGFRVSNIPSGQRYDVKFFDTRTYGGASTIRSFFSNGSNGGFQAINAPFLISSLEIRRGA